MKRRKFLQIGSACAALSVIPGYLIFGKSVRESAINLINRELNFLKLDQKGVELFVDDYLKGYHNNTLFTCILKTTDTLRIDTNRYIYTDNLIKDYLLASTFFKNRMDENKVVEYTGSFYNPYTSPCANPFSYVYFPANENIITTEQL